MDNFTKKIYTFIREKDLLRDGDNVVVGVSGGGDSVCLLYVLVNLSSVMQLHIRAVHVNHKLRPGAAEEDQKFTQNLCGRLGVPCMVYSEDVGQMARENHMSEEEAGRTFRYRCFEETACDMGGARIAVAHHLDDQSETVLMNLFRGSGISGLAGIREKRGEVIRPLLCVRKNEIEKYLRDKQISYRTDETNLAAGHTRNKLRLELLPYIRDNINAEADRHIAGMADIIADAVSHLENEAAAVYSEIVSVPGDVPGYDGGALKIDIQGFLALDKTLQREVVRKALGTEAGRLKDIEMVHIESVRKLFGGRTGSRISLPYSLIACKGYDTVVIGKQSFEQVHQEHSLSEESDGQHTCLSPGKPDGQQIDITPGQSRTVRVGDITVKLSVFELSDDKNYQFLQKSYTKTFDYDKIDSRLCLRHRRSGDYMELHDGQRKKLRRVFIDDRIPAACRDDVLLLADGQHIMWIIDNGRISEYYKITDNTRQILAVSLDR